MSLEIDPWERYEQLEELGRGAHGVIYKVKEKATGEVYACKMLERQAVNETLRRELINHRTLSPHPNVIGFKEVFLTEDKLGIILEYANGGELFQKVQKARNFQENLARFYFQQLISGLSHLHDSGVCHRDIKLENSLIRMEDDVPILKICDFGYSKSKQQDSEPHSKVGTTSYVAPEVLQSKSKYDGQIADVWSCGVQLYIMLVGRYPFDDPQDPDDMQLTVQRIISAQYEVPPNLNLSPQVKDLLRRMFRTQPMKRITLSDIKQHPWYSESLPAEIRENYPEGCGITAAPASTQAVEEIDAIITAAQS